MRNKIEREIKIPPSMSDSEAKLGVPDTFDLFMNIADEHADELGLGIRALKKRGLLWVVLRTKIKFYRRPLLQEQVTVETWPAMPARIRFPRYYRIKTGDTTLVEGKTEWGVIDSGTGKIQSPEGIFPEGFKPREESVCEEPFSKIRDDFKDEATGRDFTVQSTDIDFAGHMNNAAYVRAIFNSFSCEELRKMDVKEIEVSFREACHEGEKIRVIRRMEKCGPGIEIGLVTGEGKAAVLAKLK